MENLWGTACVCVCVEGFKIRYSDRLESVILQTDLKKYATVSSINRQNAKQDFEVLMTVTVKNAVFWGVTPCGLVVCIYMFTHTHTHTCQDGANQEYQTENISVGESCDEGEGGKSDQESFPMIHTWKKSSFKVQAKTDRCIGQGC